MAERWLVTGAGGLVGRHLTRSLVDRGASVWRTVRPGAEPAPEMTAVDFAVATVPELVALLERARPEYIAHLAGVIGADDEATMAVNHRGAARLFQAVSQAGPPFPRVVLAGSAAEYGAVRAEENPVTETTPLRPIGAYGVSKAAATLEAHVFAMRGVPIVSGRLFNVLGPGLSPRLLAGTVSQQLAAMRRDPSVRRTVELGNLTTTRDFIDVTDVVTAVEALVRRGMPGDVYNVGSGVETRVGDLVAAFVARMPFSVTVESVTGRQRGLDIPRQMADLTKVRRATGWQPTVSLADSVRTMVDAILAGA